MFLALPMVVKQHIPKESIAVGTMRLGSSPSLREFVRSCSQSAGLPALAALDLLLLAAEAAGPDLLRPSDAVVPIGVSLIVILAGLGIGRVFSRETTAISLIAVLLMLGFGTFGDVAEALRKSGSLWLIGSEPGLAVLYFLIFVGPALAISRRPRSLPTWSGYTRTFLIVLAALAIFRFTREALRSLPPPIRSDIAANGPTSGRPPDIWFLLVDKYSSSDELHRIYGLDNRPFETWLRTRGFLLPVGQRTNYPQTFLVLASLLNLRYLDDYAERYRGRSRLAAVPDIRNNRLVAFLRTKGYRFVFAPSAFDVARQNPYADEQLPSPAEVRPELQVLWDRNTALPALRALACWVEGCSVYQPPYPPESAAAVETKLAALGKLAPERPTFVFAHILLPHEPYIYHADCSRRAPYWPESDSGDDAEAQRDAYREQVTCTNRKLMSLVTAIQRNAHAPPVILIQSDHGHGRLGRPVPPLQESSADGVEERLSPFAAYALPGLPPDSLYPGISPVNVMRLVLRHYFGAALPPLEDRIYWSTTSSPFEFTRLR